MFRDHDALGAKILLFWARSGARMEPMESGKLRNPPWCVGTCACCLVVEVQFGHAVAQVGGDLETAAAKNKDMKESGIHVSEAAFPGFFQPLSVSHTALQNLGYRQRKLKVLSGCQRSLNLTVLKDKGRVWTLVAADTVADYELEIRTGELWRVLWRIQH